MGLEMLVMRQSQCVADYDHDGPSGLDYRLGLCQTMHYRLERVGGMRGMRQKTVTAYTPDGYIRIAAIEQYGKTYKPLFEMPWDYVWETYLNAFVMWPVASIRILTGTERPL